MHRSVRANPARGALFVIVLLILSGLRSYAAPRVTVDLPDLVPGMEGIEDEFVLALEDFVDYTDTDIYDALQKPLFMEGFAGAASTAPLVPHALYFTLAPSVHIGIDAAAYAKPLKSGIVDRVESLDDDSDEVMGAAIQPLIVQASFPLDFLLPNLFGGASFGYMDADMGEWQLESLSAGILMGYTYGGGRRGACVWDGISVNAGFDYSRNGVSSVYESGVLSRTESFDPDGSGPAPAIGATFRIDPEVKASVETDVKVFSAQAVTGITLIDAISLYAGLGIKLASASASLEIDADEEIEIRGELADYVESPGRVSIDGSVVGRDKFFSGTFLLGGMRVRAGSLILTMPIVWEMSRSLGAGLFMGVTF